MEECLRRTRAAHYISNAFTRKALALTRLPKCPLRRDNHSTLVRTSLLPINIAQRKRHLNSLICRVSSIHAHTCGCLSNVINNIGGGLLRMGQANNSNNYNMSQCPIAKELHRTTQQCHTTHTVHSSRFPPQLGTMGVAARTSSLQSAAPSCELFLRRRCRCGRLKVRSADCNNAACCVTIRGINATPTPTLTPALTPIVAATWGVLYV